jgi:NAD(P)H-hydrate epimerase
MPVAAMREVDRRAIEEFGIPGVVLMENAGRGAAGVALAMLSRESSPSVLVIAGRGNNGGDGYVVARHLHNAGVEVSVRVLAPFDSITGDARVNLDIIRRMQLDVREMNIPEERETLAREIASASLVVDAMLGTGTKGEVRDPFRTAIELVNASKKPVLAVDIPSGLDGDSGVALGACIVATETVTFARAKTGLVQLSAQRYVGRITVVDIGVPREILESPSDPPRK